MQQQFKRKITKYFQILRPTIKVGIFFLLLVFAFRLILPIYNFSKKNNFSREFFTSLISDKELPLKKYQDRTNVIFLGIPGGVHDGEDLTDAIMFVSLDSEKKDVVEISIPRDIWSETLKDRVNTAYHYGEEKKKGGGLILAKAIIEEVVGVPVHYGWVIDFSGFQKIIDLVGGVDIFVENAFTDKEYPIPGREDDFCGGDPGFKCRYETVHFDRGLQHMDGKQALKFVRSRHAEGEEGTDFARGRRQQLVLAAVKNKLLKPEFFWQNLKHLNELFSAFDDATDTDMNLSEQILFFKLFFKTPNQNIRRLTLDSGNSEQGRKGFLVNPPLWQYKGEWVLVPRTGNFTEIQKYIVCNLENPTCSIKP